LAFQEPSRFRPKSNIPSPENLGHASQEVLEGQILVTIETDKATVEVPSPISGTLVEYLVKSDAEIAVGEPFAILST
jgi:biotin carboxyl carrier protein